MFMIWLLCIDATDFRRQWHRVIYSMFQLTPEAAILALAGEPAPMPPDWKQVSDSTLHYTRPGEDVSCGAVKIANDGWTAYVDQVALMTYKSMDVAMAAVERWAALGRGKPSRIREGLELARDRLSGCPSAPFICGGPREMWCTYCLVRDAIEFLLGADETAAESASN
jgi:hypothetical protein